MENKETTLDDLIPKAKKYDKQLEKQFRGKVDCLKFEKLEKKVKRIEEALAIN